MVNAVAAYGSSSALSSRFSLEEIEEFTALRSRRPGSLRCGDLDQRIAALTEMREAWAWFVDTCEMPHGERECPILHELEPGTAEQSDADEK